MARSTLRFKQWKFSSVYSSIFKWSRVNRIPVHERILVDLRLRAWNWAYFCFQNEFRELRESQQVRNQFERIHAEEKKTELLTFIWREWTKIQESQPIMMFHLLVHDRTFFLNSCGWDSISIKSFWTEQCDAWTESALRVLCQFRLRWDHEIYKEFEFRSWNKPHQRIT